MKKLWDFLQIVILAAFVFAIVFVVNSYRYLIYAIVLAILCYFPLKNVIKRLIKSTAGSTTIQLDSHGKRVSSGVLNRTAFIVLLVALYIIIITLFSVSPYLDRKEFALTHPQWKETVPTSVNAESFIKWGKSKYAYVDVVYSFKTKQNTIVDTLKKAESQYAFFPTFYRKKAYENMKVEILQRAKQKIANNDMIVFYQPENPKKHQFFLSNDGFHPQRWPFYNFVFLFIIWFLCVVIFLIFRNKNTTVNSSYYSRTTTTYYKDH